MKAAGAPVTPGPSMRYRDWRDLYISGASPEEAAAAAERFRYNANVAPTLRARQR
jgi:hypothetical protein